MKQKKVVYGLVMVILLVLMVDKMNAVTVSTSVTITNNNPTIDNSFISCSVDDDTDGSYTPSAGSRNNVGTGDYAVWCTVVVSDNNSYQNISLVWAEIYESGSAWGGADDVDDHYSDASCSSLNNGTGTDAGYNCSFGSFEYYADQGSWTFQVRAWDGGTGANATGTYAQTISSLKAIEAQASIGFGTLTPGATNDPLDKTFLINNTGNDDITTTATGANMDCTFPTGVGSDIVSTNVHYAFTGAVYASACGSLGTSPEWDCGTFNIQDRESSGTNDENITYWGISIPLGVGGSCSANLEFTAS